MNENSRCSPAALSILTTSSKEGKERNIALGVWGGIAGLASAVGVLLGGLLVKGPGWRWVMFVNPISVLFVLGAILRLIPSERGRARLANFDSAPCSPPAGCCCSCTRS